MDGLLGTGIPLGFTWKMQDAKQPEKRCKMATKHSNKKRPQTDAKWAQSCEATTTRHKTTNEKLKCTTGRHRLKPKSERIDHKISQTTTNWCKTIPKRCTMSVTRCKTTDGCGLGFQSEGLAHRRRSSGLWWACVQGPCCATIRPPCWHVELYILSTLSPRNYIHICFARYVLRER